MGIDISKKPLPIGKSFFDKVIESGSYYVDKTLFIKDLIDKDAEVTLCTRPRRFGKTLNQTMLKCFFEDTAQIGGKDTRSLFRGLKIEGAGERYMEHQGKYPVIFLSFKEVKQEIFDRSYNQLKNCIIEEFERHAYVAEKISGDRNLERFKRLSSGTGSVDDYSYSLKFLSECLKNYHGKKVIILIDEYDVPLENAWSRGFYQEMIDFIRPLLASALKDNPHLQFAVMTGCLRISKESIFTGLNNLQVISILNKHYSEYFGFTQTEMDNMLEYYGFSEKRQIVRDWYNGYLFGNTEVYNPWSSVFVVDNWLADINEYPKPYWANTSGNDIVRRLVDTDNAEMKMDLETLMAGGKISKPIHEDITYDEIGKDIDPDNFWNFLFFTGYLKKVGEGRQRETGELILDLSIPNIELMYIYHTKIREWFRERISKKDLGILFRAVLDGDAETFQDELLKLLSESISYMDSSEDSYHGFMTGLLARLGGGYMMTSNRECGDGRSDLVLYRVDGKNSRAIIFEFKAVKEAGKLPTASENALKQIENKNYAAPWERENYKNIIKYGVAFCGKRCEVRKG